MFNTSFNRNPYNVPVDQIRPPGNSININSGVGDDRASALAAYQRLSLPAFQSFDQSWAQQPDGQWAMRNPVDTRLGANEMYRPPMQPTFDYNAAAARMFGQLEDQNLVRDFFNLPSFR